MLHIIPSILPLKSEAIRMIISTPHLFPLFLSYMC